MSDRLIIIKDPDGASYDPSLKWAVVDTMAAGMVVAYASTRANAVKAKRKQGGKIGFTFTHIDDFSRVQVARNKQTKGRSPDTEFPTVRVSLADANNFPVRVAHGEGEPLPAFADPQAIQRVFIHSQFLGQVVYFLQVNLTPVSALQSSKINR